MIYNKIQAEIRMNGIGPFYAIAPDNRYLSFIYNDKPRVGLALGPDTRPGTNNLACATLDGIRTFKQSKMFDIQDVTTVVA